MSETTGIQWATSTGNPWIGCTKVSPGCKNCYAATLDDNRFSRTMGGGTKENPVSHWGKGAPRFRTKGFWKDALKWNRDAERAEFERCRAGEAAIDDEVSRPRIFPSLCDWLDEEVPIEWLADFLKLIHETPNLDWLLLTKRPENFAVRIGEIAIARNDLNTGMRHSEISQLANTWLGGKALANVWIGTSVEDQQRADERIPELLKIPAAIRFLSVEPLLGPVNLTGNAEGEVWPWAEAKAQGQGVDWVIVGGESGPGARMCSTSWIYSVIRQCRDSKTPCFVKQLGSRATYLNANCTAMDEDIPLKLNHKKGGDITEWPTHLQVRQFPI